MSGSAPAETGRALEELRSDARARFEALGIPRPTDEDWRHTNVQPVAPFAATVAGTATVAAAWIDALPVPGAASCRLVTVNGRFDAALSRVPALPRGVRAGDLAAALRESPEALEGAFGRAAAFDDRAFTALNTALFAGGALVRVEPGVEVAEPIHVVHVGVPEAAPRAVHPRTLVVAGAGARVTVVESFVTAGEGVSLTNAVAEVVVGPNARVEHVRVQDESRAVWHVGVVAALQARDSHFGSHNIALGASTARNDIASRLDGEGAECRLYGLYVADGTQHVDNHTALDHALPNCPSWEMYKGVLAGSARAVFNGRIVVRPDAQKTDAKQSNKNLLLSDRAVVHTRPQLEIYANDVKCTHGATIGRLDETSLFYLRSRGIGADEARDLLVHAFADDVLGNIPDAPVREAIAAGLHRRLSRDLAAEGARP